MSRRPLRLLTVAGSDSGGGAGIQADLKTFAAHGAYGASAVTAITAQDTVGVRSVLALPPELVVAQIEAVAGDLGVDGVKVGMLADAAIARGVAAALKLCGDVPVVVDPVMVAASGDPLLEPEAVEVLRRELFPLATVITPNLPEAERIVGGRATTVEERAELARALGEEARAVLLKGSHAPGSEITDLLWDGREVHELVHARIETRAGHGTGCTLSSAIAARLAAGGELVESCRGAVEWLLGALRAAPDLGRGHAPVNHLWELEQKGVWTWPRKHST